MRQLPGPPQALRLGQLIDLPKTALTQLLFGVLAGRACLRPRPYCQDEECEGAREEEEAPHPS